MKVLIYTKQKCATTLQRRIYKSIALTTDFKFLDFAGEFWKNIELSEKYNLDYNQPLTKYKFSTERNYLIGPLVKQAHLDESESFYKIITIRNPVEMIISEYVSFGFSHQLPKGGTALDNFIKRRNYIQQTDINQYALERLEEYKEYFEWLVKEINPKTLILPFERLIINKKESLSEILKHLKKPNYIIPILKVLIWIAEKKAKNIKNHKNYRLKFADSLTLNSETEKLILNELNKYTQLWKS